MCITKIQKEQMDSRLGDWDKPRRPVRNKRYSRRMFGEEKRQIKRLFTPEIKKFLKDWLVRRRENPYPNRDEKRMLAVQTGLTYIQICNWFANWRRKLKNAGKEPQKRTWGDLIKTYNSQVQGNVEHFSICSDDSIWEEPEDDFEQSDDRTIESGSSTYSQIYNNNNGDPHNQCHFISSTTEAGQAAPFSQKSLTYNLDIMEKYVQSLQSPVPEEEKPSMIAKWLQSAEKFRPNEDSFLDWTFPKSRKKKTAKVETDNLLLVHGKEELAAAEALTTLANSSRQVKL
ncbi:putative iroquois-class homeodomain protein irx-1 isoform X2 [Cylas formicarius]|uniref:putative iroquois-class homeodomain protein irx-1 isoform X2 n=1 Tax=Cylas formicarius TaxID=197179 RepID=UPI0029588263|nr:putative iroquois-class homeodomain protein irx-1 isoform X2 [Cylas formicarius]